MKHNPDVDLDLQNVDEALAVIPHVKATMINNGKFVKHNSGIYLSNIPKEPINDMSSITYKVAEGYGYFKIDMLSVNMYDGVKSEEHLDELMNKEPVWEILHDEELIKTLPHISGHMYAIKKINPKTIEELAMVTAIIRPAKKYLLHCSMEKIKDDIWKKADGYSFKKSHAIAYATAIVVCMNLMLEE